MAKIKNCRVCGSNALTPVFAVEPETTSILWSAFKNNAGSKKNLTTPDRFAPLEEFVLCDPSIDAHACGLVQNIHTKRSDILPSAHSATFRTTREHLNSAATQALEMISGRDCAALDIGCSDGTLLSYYPRWVDRFGVDANEIVDEIGEWAWSARDQFPSTELEAAFGSKKFDIITCISTLEEIDDPIKLIQNIKSRLTDDGVFVLETIYAPIVLTGNGIEHFSNQTSAIYSLTVLERLVREQGLKICRGNLTDKEGGSVRMFITHADNEDFDFDPWTERLARLWDEETVLALRDRAPYQTFAGRNYEAREAFHILLNDIKKRAGTIHLLGTDNHAKTILEWAGSESDIITHAIDFNKSENSTTQQESGKFSSREVSIVTETQSRNLKPDYLLAPTRLKREMLECWREYIMGGGHLVFVSPEPYIVDASNYTTEFGKSLSQGDNSASVETLRAILDIAGGPRLVTDNEIKKEAASA